MRLEDEITQKQVHIKKKNVVFRKHYAPLLVQSSYLPDMTPSDIYLFAYLKKMLAENGFVSNKEMIANTEDYFKA